MPTMMTVMDRHTALDELFLAHQTAILDRDLPAAKAALAEFQKALLAHMAEEESRILPLYLARAPQPAGGGAQMFLDEHRKLRELLAGLQENQVKLQSTPAVEPRAVLKLLDQETLFKGLLDHHDRRERSFLYPGLDAVLSQEERRVLLLELGLPST